MRLGDRSRRIAGLGVAMPFELWNWADEAGAPADAMEVWRSLDLRVSFAEFCPWPIYVQNDATAACGAELAFGTHPLPQDFVYFYVGTLIGGGVVLNGSLYPGRTGNAGAFGSMPVPGPAGTGVQLIDIASLVVLERRLRADGIDTSALWRESGDWSRFEAQAEEWLAQAARGLAHAIVAACSTIDFGIAIIDGGFPAHIRENLIPEVEREVALLDTQGIAVPRLAAGTLGPIARALGGASLPLFDRYLIDQNVSMREG
jgi:predicted NBD/HSP70 family sugar kinase